MKICKRLPRLVGICFGLLICGQATAQDPLFSNGFELNLDFPDSDREAARFLVQTTFGPTPSSIAHLKDRGYQEWIREQIAAPPQLILPKAEAQLANRDLNPNTSSLGPWGSQYGRRYTEDHWFTHAVTGNDQLRQRIAFALSQIFVVSHQEAALAGDPLTPVSFLDTLTQHAFGNYRELLEAATLHPAMGVYLSHQGNRRREELEPGLFASPDENYAREVMQLFSIGLFARNQDYSLVDADPSSPGVQLLESYDENIVANLARVFTGYSFRCTHGDVVFGGEVITRNCSVNGIPCEGVKCHFLVEKFLTRRGPNRVVNDPTLGSILFQHPDSYAPMICYPPFHDTGRQPGTNTPYAQRPADGRYPNEPYRDKRIVGFWPGIGDDALPMMDSVEDCAALGNNNRQRYLNPLPGDAEKRQQCLNYCNQERQLALDALFNHPNTAPGFAHRMIQFLVTSNPSPQYVERVADAFDDNGAGVRGDLAAVIEAILLDREARRLTPAPEFGRLRDPMVKLAAFYRGAGFVSADGHWGGRDASVQLERHGQQLLFAPSVFSFYSPDYAQPGAIADQNLVSPELQIYHQITAIKSVNDIRRRICYGYGTRNSQGNHNSNCAGSAAQPFEFEQPTVGPYIDPNFLDQLPDDAEALIERFNLIFFAGQMSGSYATGDGLKGVLLRQWNASADLVKRHRTLNLLHFMVLAPEFSVQR